MAGAICSEDDTINSLGFRQLPCIAKRKIFSVADGVIYTKQQLPLQYLQLRISIIFQRFVSASIPVARNAVFIASSRVSNRCCPIAKRFNRIADEVQHLLKNCRIPRIRNGLSRPMFTL